MEQIHFGKVFAAAPRLDQIQNYCATLLSQALAEPVPLFRRSISRRTPLQVGWAQVLVTSFNLIFQVVRPRRSVVFGAEI